MIEVVTLESPEKKRYGQYFLATEDENDESEETGGTVVPEPKFNTKLINIKPSNRGKDFTIDADEPVPEEEPVEDTTPENDSPDENMDFTSDNPGVPQEDTSDVAPTIDDPSMTGPPDDPTGDLMNDQTDFNQYGEQPQPTGDDVEISTDADMNPDGEGDEPMTDDQDFTSDAEGNPDMTDPNAAPPVPEKKGPGLEYDSTRKYLLFKNYMSLSNAIENYAEKLTSCISDDIDRNKIVLKAIEKLHEINDLCNDYMLMKYEISTYIQSLLFYQNLVVMVQNVFGLLGKLPKKDKN